MTPLQAMKQALEALNKYAYYDTNKGYRCVACNTLHINSHLEWCPMLIAGRNLRIAIEEMEKAEPVAWLYTYAGKPHAAGLKPRESWADHEQHPLYTHPAPIPERLVLVHRDLIAEAFEPTPEPISTDLAKALAAAPKEPTNELETSEG